MNKVKKILPMLVLALACTSAAHAGSAAPGPAVPVNVDPKADQLLHQMSDFLGGLKRFSVQTENSLEVILQSGQKIQYDNPARLLVQRPDKLMASREGDIVNQELYYDGKNLTLYDMTSKFYATVEAPGTIDETIDFARNYMDLYAPGGDLIYSDAYTILSEDVVSGTYIGQSVVNGVMCHHLAFRNTEVDWQIWIDTGDKPLPRKFIVTTKWMTGAPQFTLVTKNWNMSPDIVKNAFTFGPPAGARQIDFISLTGGGTDQQ
jgi:hypothetical protein